MISTSDIGHGAGIAAYRLHCGLRQANINSNMIVSEKKSDNNYVHVARTQPRNGMSKFMRQIDYKIENKLSYNGLQNLYAVNSKGLTRNNLYKSSDIIHLHNIHWEKHFFSTFIFFKMRLKPLIWTLHDMWPLTARCYHAKKCEQWKSGCGKCPDLQSFISIKRDTTAFLFKIKKHLYSKANPIIVTPSNWLKNLALESPMFKNLRVECIPNGISQREFFPIDKNIARKRLKISVLKEKVVLYISPSLSYEGKGFHYFEKAMLGLKKNLSEVIVLIVGKGKISENFRKKYKVIEFGYINDFKKIVNIYSAADVFVYPTIEDNLPNVVLESLACGTPVISFNTGGVTDLIKHMENGYITSMENTEDLKEGISKLLSSFGLLKELQKNAVETIKNNFSIQLQVQRYNELYKESLKENKIKYFG